MSKKKHENTPEYVWYLEDKSYKYEQEHARYLELIKAPVIRETPHMYIIDTNLAEVIESNYGHRDAQWVSYRHQVDKEVCYFSEYIGVSEYLYRLKEIIAFNEFHLKFSKKSMSRVKKWIDNY